MNLTSRRSASTFERCSNQVRPPSLVANTRPAVPTAQPRLFPTQLVAVKRVPEPSRTLPVFQVVPALLVCRIVAPAPTNHPCAPSANAPPNNKYFVGEDWRTQC